MIQHKPNVRLASTYRAARRNAGKPWTGVLHEVRPYQASPSRKYPYASERQNTRTALS